MCPSFFHYTSSHSCTCTKSAPPLVKHPQSISARRKGYDGWFRGCPDPLVYFIYARSIIGQSGSTITKNLGRIDYGEGKCSGSVIEKEGAWMTDEIPTDKFSIHVYTAIGIEEDWFRDLIVHALIKQQLKNLGEKLKFFEENKIPKFEDVTRTYHTYFNLGHDYVGTNGVILFSGSNLPNQPPTCNREEFRSCLTKNMSKRLLVGNGRNEWKVDVKVTFSGVL